MKKTARFTVLEALLTVTEQGGYSQLVLSEHLGKLSAQDRAFATALFYGVISRRITLDYAIAQYSKTPIKKLSVKVHTVLQIGFYQLLYMPSVPQSAAVNESVNLVTQVGEKSAAGFINGVLRAFIRGGCAYKDPKDKLTALSVLYSVPMPLIQLWRKAYGQQQTLEILEGVSSVPPLFIKVNQTKITETELIASLEKQGIETAECKVWGGSSLQGAYVLKNSGAISNIKEFKQGYFHVQDLSSQLCSQVNGAKAGMRVLDVCSAPGGKTFTTAELMDNTGEIVACDLYEHRLNLVKEGAARLGLTIIKTMVQDATVYNPQLGEFDVVLCDVVCSGFGIMRRKPEIRYKELSSVAELPKLQLEILQDSSRYTKVGGRVIYSTCTLNPQENEQVVESFLEQNQNFIAEDTPHTIFPKENGGDGFFYCSMVRKN